LTPEAAADPDALITKMTTVRTARAWACKKQLRENLERKQINVVCANPEHWCTRVMRSNVEPMKEVATHVRRRLERTVARAQTRQTNGFLESINGLFQAAKRRACRFTSLSTTKTAIVGKLDFHAINPQSQQPTWISTEP
jgi:transposase